MVVANMLDSDTVESEFELQLRYYIHFQMNTLGKGFNPRIPSALGAAVRQPTHPWRKLSNLDEPDIRDTAGAVWTY